MYKILFVFLRVQFHYFYFLHVDFRFDRVAKEAVVIGGKQLPKAQVVNVLVYAMHHNPKYWKDPETFRPERYLPAVSMQITLQNISNGMLLFISFWIYEFQTKIAW